MALLYIAAGVNHFIMPEFYVPMIPFLPFPYEVVLITGIMEITLGAGLLIPRYARMFAWYLVVFLILIFPANIYMALHYPDFKVSAVVAYGRLPVQLVLIGWAYIYTRKKKDQC